MQQLMLPPRPRQAQGQAQGQARGQARERAGAAKRKGIAPDDLRYIIDGLIFGQRPVFTVMDEVNTRHGLGPNGAFILSLVDRGITSPADLALALGVSRSTITKELARLLPSGLMESREDTTDRRCLELSLTDAGREACRYMSARLTDTFERNLGHYSAQQLRLFADMLADARLPGETGNKD